MSITYELTEEEFEAVRDAKDLVSLVAALSANTANRIDINAAELLAFTSVVIGKLSAVLNAADERHVAKRSLSLALRVANAGRQSATRTRGQVAAS